MRGVIRFAMHEVRGRTDYVMARGLKKGNIRIEIICDEPIATRVLDLLVENYYQNYTFVTFVADVGVLRPEKFQVI